MMMLASSPEYDIAIGAMLLVSTCFIVWIVAHYWRKTREAGYNARLKQLMIERGMSAEEIERVLSAGGGNEVRQALQRCIAIELDAGREGGCCAGNAEAKANGS